LKHVALSFALCAVMACPRTLDAPVAGYKQLDTVLQRISQSEILPLTISTITDAFRPAERKRLRLVPQEVDGTSVSDLAWTDQSNTCYAYFARASSQTQAVDHFWVRCSTSNREHAVGVLLHWIGTLDRNLRRQIATRLATSQLEFHEEEPRALNRGRVSVVVAVRTEEHGTWSAALELRLGDLPAAVTSKNARHYDPLDGAALVCPPRGS